LIDDANFVTGTADACLLRLYNIVDNVKEMIKNLKDGVYRTGKLTSLDLYFLNRLNELGAKAYEAYDKTEYKNALKYSFYEYQVGLL
jgi:leucyl-tRNA synthetase